MDALQERLARAGLHVIGRRGFVLGGGHAIELHGMGDGEQAAWPLPSFVGTLASGQGDIAARSQDILREEMGRNSR